jgi:hypothetical protein
MLFIKLPLTLKSYKLNIPPSDYDRIFVKKHDIIVKLTFYNYNAMAPPTYIEEMLSNEQFYTLIKEFLR